MLLQIFDKTNDGRLLIGIDQVFGELFKLRPAATECGWSAEVGLEGMGENIYRLEMELDATQIPTPVDVTDLIGWLKAGESLINAKFTCELLNVQIGIKDTTYLFVKSKSLNLLEGLNRSFTNSVLSQDDDKVSRW